MTRTARCVCCGRQFDVATTTGALPSRCDTCDPGRAARRAQRTRSSSYQRQRAEMQQLRDRVAELEARLGDRPRMVRGADRLMLTRAVRRVGWAEGREATRDALLHLRDVAHTWADALAAGAGHTDQAVVDAPEASA